MWGIAECNSDVRLVFAEAEVKQTTTDRDWGIQTEVSLNGKVSADCGWRQSDVLLVVLDERAARQNSGGGGRWWCWRRGGSASTTVSKARVLKCATSSACVPAAVTASDPVFTVGLLVAADTGSVHKVTEARLELFGREAAEPLLVGRKGAEGCEAASVAVGAGVTVYVLVCTQKLAQSGKGVVCLADEAGVCGDEERQGVEAGTVVNDLVVLVLTLGEASRNDTA
mmetsp:Transcript_33174/g.55881  ORF Transcript_33174/g.55881 Transcript_33174/m.55881 type:complete len:226 (+) Transcript_33174:720-1397(+)